MIKKNKMEKLNKVLFLVIILLVGFLAGIIYTNEFAKKEKLPYISEGKTITMGIPAIDQNGNGVIGILKTTIKPGSGLVLVNVNDILAQFDTQLSGRTAAIAAGKYTGYDMKTIDIIYNVEVNASVIEGPSAGSTMAMSIVLLLQNKSSDGIMLTGTIDQEGNIGPVGGIIEKAKAAKEAGASLIIVPSGQSTEKKLAKTETCESSSYCKIIYRDDNVSIENSVGIRVVEAKDIEEALKFIV